MKKYMMIKYLLRKIYLATIYLDREDWKFGFSAENKQRKLAM